ncbi:MAG: ribonuclease domain-containing protein [Elusimicrobiales bacterium]
MIKKIFGFAALLALLVNSAPIFAADNAVKNTQVPAVLSELLSGSLSGLAVLPAPEEIKIPEALPAGENKAAGLAPKPGKDFTPVVQDKARIKAIMQLVSDIYNGKHLPYSQDGSTFKNKEGKLPAQPAGFYKEYTLLTGDAPHVVTIGGITYQVAPDLSERGSERIIIGGGEKIYYTPDHYASFILLTVVY